MEAAAFCILSPYPSSSTKFPLCPKPSPSIKLHISTSTPAFSLKFPPCPFSSPSSRFNKESSFVVCSSVQDIAVEEKPDETQQHNQGRKLFMLNLPWSFTVTNVKNIFGECGTVSDVELLKRKDGKNRGFAFVTMASREEAQAVIEKFDSQELLGRIIKVEFANRFKKSSYPPSTTPASTSPGETRHKIFVSNLAWKVRSTHLREFFTANSEPVSARVVFDSPSGRSAGYGFVSFATKEEAEAAISALDGKELLSRPLRLKFREKNVDESENKEESTTDGRPEVIN